MISALDVKSGNLIAKRHLFTSGPVTFYQIVRVFFTYKQGQTVSRSEVIDKLEKRWRSRQIDNKTI